jgi:hypothetical protein
MSYQPLHRTRPAHRWTNGDIAAKVGADLGLPPDDEQRWILDTIYAEKGADRPASFEVCVISPRQNIKTSTLGIAALADLFVFGVEKHVWSAHLADTAKETFADFRSWIGRNPEYDDRVQFYEGHQDLSIVLRDTGASIVFGSRTGKGKRGVTGVKRITVDEALYLEPKHIGAIYPTMLTQPGAQIRIASSAGLEISRELRRIRERGRAGKDPRLAYVEYGAERQACALGRACPHEVGTQGCALDDHELWWQANCALWAGRVDEESIEKLRGSMPPEEFMREMYSWWEDPESIGGALSYAAWSALADPGAPRGDLVAFGADVAEDRSAWVAVAWARDDGSTQVMLANDGQALHPDALVTECERLTSQWGGVVVPPKAFEDEFLSTIAGTFKLPVGGFTMGCGMVADRVTAGTIHHGNQDRLNDAVKAARWRSAGAYGERAFQLKDFPQVGPLAAVVRAVYGLTQAVTEAPEIY